MTDRARLRKLTAFTACLLPVMALVLASPPAAAQQAQAPAQSTAATSTPRVRVVTNLGSFVIEMNRDRAPLTVEHVLEYVREDHYAGTVFHRVISGFVAQGGGYDSDLELKDAPRTVFNESGNGLSNQRGTVGLARASDPHSGNAQFYVNLADNPDLNPRATRWGYAVFGTVIEGMDVIDGIGHRPTGAGGQFARDVPLDPIVIERVELINN